MFPWRIRWVRDLFVCYTDDMESVTHLRNTNVTVHTNVVVKATWSLWIVHLLPNCTRKPQPRQNLSIWPHPCANTTSWCLSIWLRVYRVAFISTTLHREIYVESWLVHMSQTLYCGNHKSHSFVYQICSRTCRSWHFVRATYFNMYISAKQTYISTTHLYIFGNVAVPTDNE